MEARILGGEARWNKVYGFLTTIVKLRIPVEILHVRLNTGSRLFFYEHFADGTRNTLLFISIKTAMENDKSEPSLGNSGKPLKIISVQITDITNQYIHYYNDNLIDFV